VLLLWTEEAAFQILKSAGKIITLEAFGRENTITVFSGDQLSDTYPIDRESVVSQTLILTSKLARLIAPDDFIGKMVVLSGFSLRASRTGRDDE
jgi:hypothetical protein